MKSDKKRIIISLLGSLVLISMFALFIQAVPQSPTIDYVRNLTQTDTPVNRSQDDGGYIVVMNLTISQQTAYWKAYVGNVSGSITLDDSDDYTIYDWTLTSITGEVYASRTSSITWTNIECANSTVILAEQSYLNMTVAQSFSLENTFNYSTHHSFLVSGKNITESSCNATATFVNDTKQTMDINADFQEVLLQDNSTLIYATIMEQDRYNYRDVANETYDFQMLIGEAESSATPLLYYFWVELG